MTAERLIRLLQHPEQLEFIPYEELKTLVLAYPYSHHLRQLLLLKSQQIQHHETERNLAAAAAHSLDRGLLFKRVMPSPVRQQLEVLELKPIETVLRNLEAIAPVERKEIPTDETVVTLSTPVLPTEPAAHIPSEEPLVVIAPAPDIVEIAERQPTEEITAHEPEAIIAVPEIIEAVEPQPAEEITAPEPEAIVAVPEVIEVVEPQPAEEVTAPETEAIVAVPEIVEAVEPQPTAEITAPEPELAAPAPSFSTWVMQFNLPSIQSETPRVTVAPPPPAPRYAIAEEEEDAPVIAVKEKGMAQQLAERSVAEKEEVASETLAKILVRQGYKDRAISMYQRLMVANPEKSAIFAAAIEELKK